VAAAAITQLVHGYARAVDRRDREALVALFTEDAVLDFDHRTVGSTGTYAGLDEIGAITERIARFDRTFHHMGGHVVEVAGRTAAGEAHCIAHHVRFDLADHPRDGVDEVLLIRYVDGYRQDDDDRWRIARRRVEVDWMETRRIGPQVWR
jgi:ketosteroid isomerase-like protein